MSRSSPEPGRSARAIPARIRWAAGLVDPQPGDVVLEIGGGPGALAEFVCPFLDDGVLIAVDRSATAIARSTERNQQHVDAGRLRHINSSLANLDPQVAPVDKAVAVNVNLFWTTEAEDELAVLRLALKPGGWLFILYGQGPSGTADHLHAIHCNLERGGFTGIDLVSGPDGTGISAHRP